MSTFQCNVDLQAVQTILIDNAQQANRDCHFSQRNRQMNATQFAQLLVLGWLHNPHASLNELALQSERLGFSISPQGLDARLNEGAVVFLAAVLQEALLHSHPQIALANGKLRGFSGIFITDSTQIRLPEALKTVFRAIMGVPLSNYRSHWTTCMVKSTWCRLPRATNRIKTATNPSRKPSPTV
jgi:hypothetical protein